MSVSVVIPTYNEAPNLPLLLPNIKYSLTTAEIVFEIIIVDDASPDGTGTIAKRIGTENDIPIHIVNRTKRRSLASAVIEGQHHSSYDCIAVMDADLSHDPALLPFLVHPVVTGDADLTIGSRYIIGGKIVEWSRWRSLLSRTATICARLLTPVKDPLSGFFAYRRSSFSKAFLTLRPRGYKILLDLLVCRRDIKVKEIPITFSNRKAGASKLGIQQYMEFLMQFFCLGIGECRRRSSTHETC